MGTDGPKDSGTSYERLQALATLGTLAAGTAHEVNNVVTHLLASLQQAQNALEQLRDSATEQRFDRLEVALDTSSSCCDRLRSVARGMTSCARPADSERTLIAITDILDEAIDLVAPELKQNAVIRREYEAVLPPVRANAGKLVQVFINLLVNAMHAMTDGKNARTAHCVTIEANLSDDWICVEVRDTGDGIPAEAMDRIFEPFFTTKPVGVGTGLGLSVSRDIVSELGGQISVDSKPGTGTTFSIYLPCA